MQRWRKFGRDRVFVTTPEGSRVGWADLQTGIRHLEQPSYRAAFEAALAPLCQSGAAPCPVPAPRERPAAEDVELDLAERRPGQGVREEAQSQLAAMRERTRLGTLLARALDLRTDERAFRLGALGEESVGARLDRLRAHGWKVLHSVPVGSGDSDIDHVLIGPAGVFTINTKHHPGKKIWVSPQIVMVDGFRQPYLRNSRHEAQRASRLLSARLGSPVDVRAALVFVTGSLMPDVTIKRKPDDVLVLDLTDIPRVFKRAQHRLDVDAVERIYEVARRSTTWLG